MTSVLGTAVLGAMGDPLLNQEIDFTAIAIVIGKTVFTFALLLVAVMLMIWFERKVIADMQNRIGPNRAGPWGILQTLADGIKFFFKEDLIPDRADRLVFKIAPYLAMVPAFLSFAIVPLGGTIELFGRETRLQLADPPVGILFLLAMSAVAVYGVMLAGWASGSKYPLLGSVRASAQMVSYEAALGLSVVTVVLVTGSLYTSDIVFSQSGNILDWNLIRLGIVPFIIFLIAATAELNRPPFDLVEAEQELVGGFHTEYSSIRFALFFLAEFMNTVTMSAVIVTLFFGGPTIPWDVPFFTSVSPVWFLLKVLVFLFTYVWFRATLPRLRYDQLMDLGWKVLIPLALAWLLVIAAIRMVDTETALQRFLIVAAAFGAGLLCAVMLIRSLQLGRDTVLEEDLHG
ncbi:MAG TPA: NADH-quinone oxidoreductase subunit NuoH [Acidimicrobiales bacterium]|nr:NADH-quinone oxidoreductase subunit NuoH [Acidimicrobiales bacterium]